MNLGVPMKLRLSGDCIGHSISITKTTMAPSVVVTLNMVTTIPSSNFASGNESANITSTKNGVANLSSSGQDLLLAFNIFVIFKKCCAKITEGHE